MKAAASEDVAVGARVPGVMKLSASEVVGGDGALDVSARGATAMAVEVFPMLAMSSQVFSVGGVGDAGGTRWTGISAVAVAEPAVCGNAIVCAKLSASEAVGSDGALDVPARGATALAVEAFAVGIEAFELGGVGDAGGMWWTGILAVAAAEPADCVVCACAAGDGLVGVPARGGTALAVEAFAIRIEASEFGTVGDAGGTCWTGISALAAAEPADCGNAIVCAKLSASEVVGSDGALDVPARGVAALAKKPCKIIKL